MNDNLERLKDIKIEEYIWIIYLIVIGLCFYGNIYEKNYFLYGCEQDKQIYRNITIFIFVIALLIYLYFFKDGLESVNKLKVTDSNKKKFETELNLLASTFILIAGFIFLYIAIVDTDLDIELAFS